MLKLISKKMNPKLEEIVKGNEFMAKISESSVDRYYDVEIMSANGDKSLGKYSFFQPGPFVSMDLTTDTLLGLTVPNSNLNTYYKLNRENMEPLIDMALASITERYEEGAQLGPNVHDISLYDSSDLLQLEQDGVIEPISEFLGSFMFYRNSYDINDGVLGVGEQDVRNHPVNVPPLYRGPFLELDKEIPRYID